MKKYFHLQTVSGCDCQPCKRKNESTSNIFDSIDFYIGRLIRILPIYYLCLIAGTILIPLGFLTDPNCTITTSDYGNFSYRFSKWGSSLVRDLIQLLHNAHFIF